MEVKVPGDGIRLIRDAWWVVKYDQEWMLFHKIGSFLDQLLGERQARREYLRCNNVMLKGL